MTVTNQGLIMFLQFCGMFTMHIAPTQSNRYAMQGAEGPSLPPPQDRQGGRERDGALDARLEILEKLYAASREEISELRRRQANLEEQLDLYWARRSTEAQAANRADLQRARTKTSGTRLDPNENRGDTSRDENDGGGMEGERALQAGDKQEELLRAHDVVAPEASGERSKIMEEEVAALFAPGGPLEAAFSELRLSPGEELVNSLDFQLDVDNLRRQILNCSGALAELHAKVASFSAHLLVSDASRRGLEERAESVSAKVSGIASQTSEYGLSLVQLGARLQTVEDKVTRALNQSLPAGVSHSSSSMQDESINIAELRAELMGQFRDLESRFDDLQVQFVMATTARAD